MVKKQWKQQTDEGGFVCLPCFPLSLLSEVSVLMCICVFVSRLRAGRGVCVCPMGAFIDTQMLECVCLHSFEEHHFPWPDLELS